MKRKVGRPRKYPIPLQENNNNQDDSEESPRKKIEKNSINRWVYNQCMEYQKNNQFFSKKLVSEWFNEAQKACLSPYSRRNHKYSHAWLNNFQEMYGIIGSPCTLRIKTPSTSHVEEVIGN